MIKTLKSQKGITGIDLSISLIIIMLFISIIVALSMNVSSSLSAKKRLDIATNCMTEVIEKIDGISYNQVSVPENSNNKTVNNITKKEDNSNNYSEGSIEYQIQNILNNNDEYKILNIDLLIEKYVPDNYTPDIEGDTPPDLVKKVTVTIKYNLDNKDETIEVTRLKTIYNVELEDEQ